MIMERDIGVLTNIVVFFAKDRVFLLKVGRSQRILS